MCKEGEENALGFVDSNVVPEGLSDKADFLWKAEQGHSVGLPLSQGMTSMLPWLLPSTEGHPSAHLSIPRLEGGHSPCSVSAPR